MLVACWSVKGGSGTTVVSAALALAVAATGHDALLVDMGGDVPAALGVPEPAGPGLADWLGGARRGRWVGGRGGRGGAPPRPPRGRRRRQPQPAPGWRPHARRSCTRRGTGCC